MEKRTCKHCQKEFEPKTLIWNKKNKIRQSVSKAICCSRSCSNKLVYSYPGHKEKRSQAIKKAFEDPKVKERLKLRIKETHSSLEYREKMRRISTKAMANPKTKEKHRKAVILALSSPKIREKHKRGIEKSYSDPEILRKKRLANIKTLSNPETRKKLSITAKASHQNKEIEERRIASLKKTLSSPENKAKRSEISKSFYSNKDNAERHRKALKIVMSSSSTRKKLSESLKRAFSSTEAREKKSKAAKKAMSNPEVKRAMEKIYSSAEYKAKMSVSVKKAQSKAYATKKANNTFHTSAPENRCFSAACETFGEGNIIRQHRTDKYPFASDFYISSIDTFIECHFSWTHGGAPYDANDPAHQKQLSDWQQKGQEMRFSGKGNKGYYDSAIKTWTVSDPKKVATAAKNGVNLKVFYTEKKAIDWLSSLKKE